MRKKFVQQNFSQFFTIWKEIWQVPREASSTIMRKTEVYTNELFNMAFLLASPSGGGLD